MFNKKEYKKQWLKNHPNYYNEYIKTEKAKKAHRKTQKKYQKSKKGKEVSKKAHKKYYIKKRDEILRQMHVYQKSDRGKIAIAKAIAKAHAKRKNLGFTPINEYFNNCQAHHINKDYIIHIPKEIHKSIYHSVLRNINMIEINSLAFTWFENNKKGK